MINPFKIFVVVAVVIAVALAAGFVAVVFVQNGGSASSLGTASVVETA